MVDGDSILGPFKDQLHLGAKHTRLSLRGLGALLESKTPSGTRLHNYGKPPFLLEKSTIALANSI